jgi:hypothetical protein
VFTTPQLAGGPTICVCVHADEPFGRSRQI